MDPTTKQQNTSILRRVLPFRGRKAGDKPPTTEIGVSGESLLGVYADAEKRADKYTAQDYNKMLDTDGTITSLYNLMTLSILSTTFIFEPDEDDSNKEQADFIKSVLTDPPHKGGMEIPFKITLSDMLRAVLEGFRTFERVYTIRDDGKIAYRKLGPLDASTVYLIRADDSTYGGLHQRTSFKGQYHDVYIAPEKTFLFTYNKAFNFLYGKSAFKAAAYHYEIKHKLYYLANLSVQVAAIAPAIISGPQATENDVRNKLLRAFAAMGLKTTIYKPEEYTAEPWESKGTSNVNVHELIDMHNSEIYRSCLAQFLMLGQASRSVGSWSLSESHSDIFMLFMRAIMDLIEEHINYYIIPDLIDLNFAKPCYPTFKFENISPDAQEIIHDAFTQLATHGQLSEAMERGIEDLVADKLEVDKEEIQKTLDKEAIADAKKQAELAKLNPQPVVPGTDPYAVNPANPNPPGTPQPAPAPGAPPQPAKQPIAAAGQKKKNLANTDRRQLTPAEQRTNFDAIEQHMDKAEAAFVAAATPLIRQLKDKTLASISRSGVSPLSVSDLATAAPAYRSLMAQTMRDSYEFGKKTAADDMKSAAPATTRDATQRITQQAASTYDKQMSDLTFGVKNAVLSGNDNNLGDVLQKVSGQFEDFIDNHVSVTGTVSVSKGVNLGRDVAFAANQGNISRYQWSAILDARTCPLCEGLDGMVVDQAGKDNSQYQPDHPNGRCLWVQILNDEANPPDFTGIPDDPELVGKAKQDARNN